MGAFDFRRPGGVWADGSVFSPEDAADFDLKLTKCLNAAEGGSWAPSDVISIGGDGVEITTSLQLGPEATFSLGGEQGVDPGFYIRATSDANKMTYTDMPFTAVDDVTLGGGPGATNIEKVVRVYGRLLIPSTQTDSSSYVLSCSGPSHFGQNMVCEAQLSAVGLTVTGGAILNGTVNMLGATSIELGGDVISAGADEMLLGGGLDSDLTLEGPWKLGVYGRILDHAVVATSALAGYSPTTTQWVNVPANVLSAAGYYTIQNADTRNSDAIGFSNRTAFDLNILDGSGTIIQTIWANHWAEFKRIDGVFACIKMGSFLKHSVAD